MNRKENQRSKNGKAWYARWFSKFFEREKQVSSRVSVIDAEEKEIFPEEEP